MELMKMFLEEAVEFEEVALYLNEDVLKESN